MDSYETLVTVTEDDVDWSTLKKLPDDVVHVAHCLSFHYPSFIRSFKNGVAEVLWQLNPDGRYYMDDDGFGMTSDVEMNIYGFIDAEGKVVVRFQAFNDSKDLMRMRKEAEDIVKARNNN